MGTLEPQRATFPVPNAAITGDRFMSPASAQQHAPAGHGIKTTRRIHFDLSTGSLVSYSKVRAEKEQVSRIREFQERQLRM
jgi:hypothetical protein